MGYEENTNKRFVNPYNFIPLMGSCERSVPEIRKNDNYTGYFDCSITLLTPLFIPNTSSSTRLLTEKEKQDDKCVVEGWKGYDFFSYDDWSDDTSRPNGLPLPPADPVIPGSELRGAVRSVYEAAFNGCMSSVSADRVLSRRNVEAKKREVFKQTIGELLKNNGGYEPCADEQLCPACQIFGMIGKSAAKGTYAYGSKVRVTDARLIRPAEDSKALFEEPIILPELGEPKPSAVEFYTNPPYASEKLNEGNGFWTYDYKYKVCGGKVTRQREDLSSEKPELRGRKYYWHSIVELRKYQNQANKVSAMKQRIRPMKAGNTNVPLFHFRIYFEQLSKQQMTELKWVLDFGNADCAHKIGRAKPLGFGSVRMQADSISLRKINTKTGCWAVENINLEEFFADPAEENQAQNTLQMMANWQEKPENVRYPSVEMKTGGNEYKPNMDASHQWFAGNRSILSVKPNFFKVLPEAKDEANNDLCQDKALYTLIVDKK